MPLFITPTVFRHAHLYSIKINKSLNLIHTSFLSLDPPSLSAYNVEELGRPGDEAKPIICGKFQFISTCSIAFCCCTAHGLCCYVARSNFKLVCFHCGESQHPPAPDKILSISSRHTAYENSRKMYTHSPPSNESRWQDVQHNA